MSEFQTIKLKRGVHSPPPNSRDWGAMSVYQISNFSAVSVKQKNHPVKDGFVENIAPMVRRNRCSFIRYLNYFSFSINHLL